MNPFKPGTGKGIPFSGSDVSSFRFIPFFDCDPETDPGKDRTTNDVADKPEVGRHFPVTTVTVLNNNTSIDGSNSGHVFRTQTLSSAQNATIERAPGEQRSDPTDVQQGMDSRLLMTSHSSASSRSSKIFPTIVTSMAFHNNQNFNRNTDTNSTISTTLPHMSESALSTISYKRLPTTGSSSSASSSSSVTHPTSAVTHLECRRDDDIPKPIIKSPTRTTSLKPNRKCVTFSGSDLVHVTGNLSPSFSPTDELFPRYQEEEAEEESDPRGDVLLQDDSAEFWTESSTDADPMDSVSSTGDRMDQVPSPPPLSFVNDVFGRTTIFVTSGTFRPSDVGKLNGKTVEDLSRGPRGGRRSLSTGTLNGIQSNRTRVRIDVTQGVLLDINHNPGQTAEVDSKAVTAQDNAVSTNIYSGNILKDAPKGVGAKEFPKRSSLVKQKICDKLSRYKFKLILIFCLTFLIVSLTIGLALGLRH